MDVNSQHSQLEMDQSSATSAGTQTDLLNHNGARVTFESWPMNQVMERKGERERKREGGRGREKDGERGCYTTHVGRLRVDYSLCP